MHPGHSSLCIIKTMLGGVHVVDAFFLIALRCLDPVFLFFLFLGGGGYHPTLKLSGIPIFTFIVSLTHRMDNIDQSTI